MKPLKIKTENPWSTRLWVIAYRNRYSRLYTELRWLAMGPMHLFRTRAEAREWIKREKATGWLSVRSAEMTIKVCE